MLRSFFPKAVVLALVLTAVLTAGPARSACGSKTYCTEMASCAEAYYNLTVCGLDRLDADKDGIPCESVCGKQTGTMQARIQANPYQPDAEGSTSTGLGLLDTGEAASAMDAPAPAFTCAGKRTCRQMTSCAEATHYLNVCGVRALDGNRDGVACNGLCRR